MRAWSMQPVQTGPFGHSVTTMGEAPSSGFKQETQRKGWSSRRLVPDTQLLLHGGASQEERLGMGLRALRQNDA